MASRLSIGWAGMFTVIGRLGLVSARVCLQRLYIHMFSILHKLNVSACIKYSVCSYQRQIHVYSSLDPES